MNFLRKNWLTLLLSVFLVSMFLFPDFRAFVQRQILMKPSLEKVEKDVTFTAEEMNIQLKGGMFLMRIWQILRTKSFS